MLSKNYKKGFKNEFRFTGTKDFTGFASLKKSLEFKLIVMDEKGQKDTDTINFLLNQENDEESKT